VGQDKLACLLCCFCKDFHVRHNFFSSSGLIEFKNMSLYYGIDTAPALKNINMTVEPGSKVGIVGR